MADRDHTVKYTAKADFSDLMIQAAKARQELAALNRSLSGSNSDQVKGSDAVTAATHRKTAATQKDTQAVNQSNEARMKGFAQEIGNLLKAQQILENTNKIAERKAQSEARAATARDMAQRRELAASERLARQQADSVRREELAQTRLATRQEADARRQQALQDRLHRQAESNERRQADERLRNFGRAAAERLKYVQKQEADERRLADERLKNFARAAAERLKQSQRDGGPSLLQLRNIPGNNGPADRVLRDSARDTDNLEKATRRLADRLRESSQHSNYFTSTLRLGLAGVLLNMNRAWRSADDGTSSFRRLGQVIRSINNDTNRTGFFSSVARSFVQLTTTTGHLISKLADLSKAMSSLFRSGAVAGAALAGIAGSGGALVSIIGAAVPVLLAAAGALVSIGGVAATLPSLLTSIGVGFGAVVLAVLPVVQAFKDYATSQNNTIQADQSAAKARKTAAASYQSALLAVTRAEEDLTRARKDAARALVDLRSQASHGVLDEKQAVLDLKFAQLDYNKTLKDGTATKLDKEQADLRVKRAELDLADAKTKNKRNTEDLNEANKKGIEGSDRVRSAQENLTQATSRLADAQQSLVDAQNHTTAGVNKYQTSLDKLSPSQRAFVTGLLAMKSEFDKISTRVGEGLFKPIVGEMASIRGFLPTVNNLLGSAAETIGKVTARGIELVTSGPWKKDFGTLAKANVGILSGLGDTALKMLDAFRNFGVASLPAVKLLVDYIELLSDDFLKFTQRIRSTGELNTFLAKSIEQFGVLVDIVKNVTKTIFFFTQASNDFTDTFLGNLQETTAGWADYAKAQQAATSPLRKYLVEVQPLLSSVTHLISDFTKAFTSAAANPENIQHASEIFEILRTEILPEVVRLLGQLSKTGIDRLFLEFIGDTLETLNKLVESGVGGALVGFASGLAVLGKVLNAFFSNETIATVIGSITFALGALAAASFIGKFTGLFALVKVMGFFFTNRNNLSTAVISKLLGTYTAGNAQAVDQFNRFSTRVAGFSGAAAAATSQADKLARVLREHVGPNSTATAFQIRRLSENIIATNPAWARAVLAAESGSGRISGASRIMSTAFNGVRSAASGLVGALGGPWGIAITAAVVALGLFASANARAAAEQKALQNAARDLQAQIIENNGVISDSILRQASKELVDNGAADAAERLGLSIESITDAYLGNSKAIDENIAKLEQIIKVKSEAAKYGIDDASFGENVREFFIGNDENEIGKLLGVNDKDLEGAEKLLEILKAAKIGADAAQKASANYNKTNKDGKPAAQENAAAQKTLSDAMKVLADNTSTADQKIRALKDAQDALTGTRKTQREADEAAAAALLAFNEGLEQNGRAFDLASREGLSNRDNLERYIETLQDQYATNVALGMSEADAKKAYDEKIEAIYASATAMGVEKAKIDEIIETSGQIPTKIAIELQLNGLEATKAGFKEAMALAQSLVSQFGFDPSFAAKAAAGNVDKNTSVAGNAAERAYIKQYKAGGGYVSGAGSSTSDSIPARLSNGEFVVNARAASRNLPLLHSINNHGAGRMRSDGRMGFADGGQVSVTDSLKSTSAIITGISAQSSGVLALWGQAAADADRVWKGITEIVAGHLSALVGDKGVAAGPVANLNTFLLGAWTGIQEMTAGKWTEIANTVAGKVADLSGDNSPLKLALIPIQEAFTATWEGVTVLTKDNFTVITQTVLDQLKVTKEGTEESLHEILETFKKVYGSLPGIIDSAMNSATGSMVTGWNKIIGKINEGLKAVNEVTTKFGFDISGWQIKAIDAPQKDDKKTEKKASGGHIAPRGGGETADKIPAWLSDNEYVVKASSVRKLGVRNLDYINQTGSLPGYAAGGYVDHPNDAPRFASGGIAGIVALARKSGAGANVTSSYRPGDPGHHGSGNAVDFGGYNQHKLASFFMSLAPALLELIHTTDKGGYYVKNGRRVSAGFYGAQVPLHRNHVHVAMTAGSAAKALGGKIPQIAGDLLGGLLPAFDVEAAMDELKDSYKENILGAISGDDKKTVMGGLLGGVMTKAQDKFMGFSRKKAEEYAATQLAAGDLGGTLGNIVGGGSGGGAARWSGLVTQVLKEIGVFTPGNLSAVLTSIQQESGGNPNAVQNGYTDVNTKSGDLAKGLNQVIGATFRANAGKYKDKGQFDPYANIYASVKYAMGRYGNNWASRMAAPGGYAQGGLVGGSVHDHGGLLSPGRSVVNNMTGGLEGVLNGKGLAGVGGPQGLAALNTGMFGFADGGLVSSGSYSSSGSNGWGRGSGKQIVINQQVNALPGMNASDVANLSNRKLAQAVITGTSSLTHSTL